MSFERLTATDAAFLHIESSREPQHVGSLSELEGAPLRDASGRVRIEDVRSFMAGRLHRVPRLRQKVMFVPYGAGRPVWVDDEHFDIDYHVRLTALPRPGDDRQLCELFGRLQSLPLDRSRPLWEMWLVDGLEGDRVAIVNKTHHAMGDGIANVALVLATVDLEPDPADDPPAPPFEPRPAPSARALLVNSMAEQVARPVVLAESAMAAWRHPRTVARTLGNAGLALKEFLPRSRPAPWNVPVTAHRRWVHADVSLAAVRAVRHLTDATVNDVVLELCAGALRDYLVVHGEDVADRTLTAMVPVSRRHNGERGTALGNQVSLIVIDLPIGVDDPAERLARIHTETNELKASGLADGVEAMVSAAGELTMLAAPLARVLTRSFPMNLVITNIPGPPAPLYVRGARVLRAYPYVEVIDNEGLTIAVVSYDGNLSFGITSDRDVMPDLQHLATSIEAGIERLADAVAGRSAG